MVADSLDFPAAAAVVVMDTLDCPVAVVAVGTHDCPAEAVVGLRENV